MITIYDWFGYSLPIYERYHLIKQAGFDGVLLWWSDGFGRGDYPDGPKLAQKAGLFIENIHAPIQNQNDLWLDNLKGEALTNCCLQCIKDCSDFRIPTMVVHLHDNREAVHSTSFLLTEKLIGMLSCKNSPGYSIKAQLP